MRKKKLLPCLFMIVSLMVILLFPAVTEAAETTDNGIHATLITDRNAYRKNDVIHAEFALDNTGINDLTNIHIQYGKLDGYKIQYDKKLSSVKAGEKATVKVDYIPSGSKLAFGGKTGDQSKILLFALTGVIALIIILWCIKKKDKKLLSILLVLSMTAGLLPLNTIKAEAAGKETTITQKIKVGGKEKAITVTYSYTVKNPDQNSSADGKSITVKFDSAGGTAVKEQTIPAGSLLTEPEAPTKDGYLFVGWFLDKKHQFLYDFSSYVPQQDGYLYAYWINPDDTTDTDEDGIFDSYEKLFGTDPNKKDTDGDGLPDAYEIEPLGLSPVDADTDGNGVKDGREDNDKDGLTNLEEYKLGTKPGYADSDMDGLSDGEEVHKYKTDPLKEDTDGDGVSDGKEIEMGTDPLTAQSTFNAEASAKGEGKLKTVKVIVSLPGEQVESLEVESNDSGLFPEDMPGYIGKAYDFSVDGELSSETKLQFQMDKSLLEDPSFNPVIYYYNLEKSELEPLETTVNRETGIATAITPHFSTYILLNKTEFDKIWTTDIRKPSADAGKGLTAAFVLDRSESMNDNDPDSIRLKLTKEYIQKMEKNRDAGSLITFIAKSEVVTPLTNDLDSLAKSVDSVWNDSGYWWNSGTNGSAGIHEGLEQLKKDTSGNDRIMLFMTDGEDNRTSYSYDELIEDAKNNNIIIYTIGLGKVDDTLLKKIAVGTGGKYYYASTADDLNAIFKDTERETIDYVTDSNNDGITDYYTKQLCESGKYVNGALNPFSGLSYNNVQANDDYDSDGLKNGEELQVESRDGDDYIHLAMSSDPTKKDSDNDGLYDNEPRVSKGAEIAPKDPNPLVYDGAKNMWKDHIETQINAGTSAKDKNKPVATAYKEDVTSLKGDLPEKFNPVYDFVKGISAIINDEINNGDYDKALSNIKNIALDIKYQTTVQPIEIVHKDKIYNLEKEMIHSILGEMLSNFIIEAVEKLYTNDVAYVQAILGGKLLNFIPDTENVALHSQPHTWQRAFGYTDFYDLVFDTCSLMNYVSIDFKGKDLKSYRLWMWKGDYWNLQSGTEIGLYVESKNSLANGTTKVFNAVDYEIPMYVCLYNYDYKTTKHIKDNIFNWNPQIPQWWGTGFNWRYQDPKPENMITIGSIDLKNHIGLYEGLKANIYYKNKLIFDDASKKIWIQWNNEFD